MQHHLFFRHVFLSNLLLPAATRKIPVYQMYSVGGRRSSLDKISLSATGCAKTCFFSDQLDKSTRFRICRCRNDTRAYEKPVLINCFVNYRCIHNDYHGSQTSCSPIWYLCAFLECNRFHSPAAPFVPWCTICAFSTPRPLLTLYCYTWKASSFTCVLALTQTLHVFSCFQVRIMYHDSTIGNAVNIVLVRIMFLAEEEVSKYAISLRSKIL